jgi:hypothetical protein
MEQTATSRQQSEPNHHWAALAEHVEALEDEVRRFLSYYTS